MTLQKRASGLVGEAEAPHGSCPLLQGKIGKQSRGHSRVELEIRLPDGTSAAEFPPLLQWLRRERDLQGRVSAKRRPPQQEELGGTFELISVAVGSGGFATACVTSLASWLSGRRVPPTLGTVPDDVNADFHHYLWAGPAGTLPRRHAQRKFRRSLVPQLYMVIFELERPASGSGWSGIWPGGVVASATNRAGGRHSEPGGPQGR